MSFERGTFRQLTAPGYFNFSPSQSEKTAQIAAWLDGVTEFFQDQQNLFDLTFRQWATRDYAGLTPSLQMYLYYLSQRIGFTWIQSNLNTERDLLSYLYSPRPETFSDCINQLYNLLVQVGWISGVGQVIAGKGAPINFAELLIIFTDAPYVPSTPGNTAYARRAWAAPSGWTKAPASSTYMCRGYLYNGEIVWLPPVSTAAVISYFDVAALSDLSLLVASDGDVAGVYDDGSGDTGAIYTFYDGDWFKCSTLYNLQGSVYQNTYLDSSGIFAPDDPLITSQTPPPVSGPSKGYGFYGLFGVNPTTENVELVITLTADGFANLGVIIALIRKIKPFVNRVYLYATYGEDVYLIEIKDLCAIN